MLTTGGRPVRWLALRAARGKALALRTSCSSVSTRIVSVAGGRDDTTADIVDSWVNRLRKRVIGELARFEQSRPCNPISWTTQYVIYQIQSIGVSRCSWLVFWCFGLSAKGYEEKCRCRRLDSRENTEAGCCLAPFDISHTIFLRPSSEV